VAITDTGVGVQAGQWDQLFAPPKLGALVHGRGLSLYLARKLARSMGGDVTLVASELEQGSTFALALPLATGSASSAGTTSSKRGKSA